MDSFKFGLSEKSCFSQVFIQGQADTFFLHLDRKWTGKDILIKKKEICLHQLFSKVHYYFLLFHQRCTSFWKPCLKKLLFCFWNHFLTADFISSTTLPSVLPYSHQHADHHKTACIHLCISIGGTFSAVQNSITARCLNRTSKNSSISMRTGWRL